MTTGRVRIFTALAVLAFTAGCNSSPDNVTTEAGSEKFNPTAKVEKACYRPGEKATVVTTNALGANIVYVPVYSDQLARDDAPRGDADAKGEFRASWVIPTDAPAGAAEVRIAIAAGEHGKQIKAPFEVAGTSGTCSASTNTTALATGTTIATGSTLPGATTVPGSSGTPTTTSPEYTIPTTIPEIGEGGDFKTTAKVTKACVEPAGTQTIKVTTTTKERAAVTYVIAYPEGSQGNSSNGGTTDSNRSYEDTFVVPPGIKPGTATVQVTVQSQDGKSLTGVRFKVGNC